METIIYAAEKNSKVILLPEGGRSCRTEANPPAGSHRVKPGKGAKPPIAAE